MARYHFDLDDGSDIRDEFGREIDDPVKLRSEALRIVTERTARDGDTACILTVRNADGITRLKVRLVCEVESF